MSSLPLQCHKAAQKQPELAAGLAVTHVALAPTRGGLELLHATKENPPAGS